MPEYDGVVVMGSGYANAIEPLLDKYAVARCKKAAESIKRGEVDWLIVTGRLSHPATGVVFAEKAAEFLLSCGVGKERIVIAPAYVGYTLETEGDVGQVVKFAGFRYYSFLIVTERPHYYFRVRRFFKKKAPCLRIRLRPSMPAPWWYWVKEFALWFALLLSPRKGKHSWLYHSLDQLWRRRIGPKFLQYVVRRD